MVMLQSRQPIRSNTEFAWVVDSSMEGGCLITHEARVLSDTIREHRTATQVIDVLLDYLAVGLDQHHFVAEVLEASLDCRLET